MSTADNNEFGRLHEYHEVSLLEQVSGEDGPDDDYDSDDCEHVGV